MLARTTAARLGRTRGSRGMAVELGWHPQPASEAVLNELIVIGIGRDIMTIRGSSSWQLLREAKRAIRTARERVLWGGPVRERLLLRLLGGYYESVFRREWTFGGHPPHFENHRIDAFRFGFGSGGFAPEYFFRGFFSAEVLRPGDHALDIGCGDGFFTKRFLAARAQQVDGIDIEPTAVAEAARCNSADNVRYLLVNAVTQPFPSSQYDAVLWDGALAHFSADGTRDMLSKIRTALSSGGVFSGSESLGHEGDDHLQVFEDIEAVARLFRPFWKHVAIREVRYSLVGGFVRREAYWRCSDDPERLGLNSWTAGSELNRNRLVDSDGLLKNEPKATTS